MNNYIIGHALHFIDYNLYIWQLRKLQHKHHYLVPSTAQECHLNDARQTSCDHVHQDSECKKWKDIVIQDQWISRELSSYYRFTQWFGPTLTATEPLFSKSGDLERVGHLIWVKIQICENHMSEHFSCTVMQCSQTQWSPYICKFKQLDQEVLWLFAQKINISAFARIWKSVSHKDNSNK